MEHLTSVLSPHEIVFAAAVGLLAGLVKGMVGFAMPMIMISGLSAVLAPDLALATLILPTLLTNGIQGLRQGGRAALASLRRFRVFLAVGLIFLLISAQLVAVLSQRALFLLVGGPITLFAAVQLAGWRFRLAARSTGIEVGLGAVAGFVGGMSGVWGPPTVAYLTAIGTPKVEQMRIQGVVYGLGALALFAAHLQSGVLRAETLPLSAAMIVPALAGLWLGFLVQERVDQATFRTATLAVLLVAGLNLLRRAAGG